MSHASLYRCGEKKKILFPRSIVTRILCQTLLLHANARLCCAITPPTRRRLSTTGQEADVHKPTPSCTTCYKLTIPHTLKRITWGMFGWRDAGEWDGAAPFLLVFVEELGDRAAPAIIFARFRDELVPEKRPDELAPLGWRSRRLPDARTHQSHGGSTDRSSNAWAEVAGARSGGGTEAHATATRAGGGAGDQAAADRASCRLGR